KYMPLNGLRWSRDSGSALCGTPPNGVLGQAGGGSNTKISEFSDICKHWIIYCYLMYCFLVKITNLII
ncbi:hypothetical protein, partial [uncultured Prevotella sp.]|uniref:hypothetical protein n=1 Tax=uncultured Prevotella sp. TaxID=159272 RepID=UPI0028044600